MAQSFGVVHIQYAVTSEPSSDGVMNGDDAYTADPIWGLIRVQWAFYSGGEVETQYGWDSRQRARTRSHLVAKDFQKSTNQDVFREVGGNWRARRRSSHRHAVNVVFWVLKGPGELLKSPKDLPKESKEKGQETPSRILSSAEAQWSAGWCRRSQYTPVYSPILHTWS